MRADAKENYNQLLAAAHQVVSEQGAGASLRDVARRAGVGPATLFRHFPTREALLDTLLRDRLDQLTRLAGTLAGAGDPGTSLVSWLRDAVSFVTVYSGAVTLMSVALEDQESALHHSCASLRVAGASLLSEAQQAGAARMDLTSEDLFALISALGWINDQPAFSRRSDHLFNLIVDGILVESS
jgi:AcrR family transcriptional regulator